MSIRSSNNIKIEGGMSSMTDLVFLLLIFFIILSALAKNNNTLDVNLPQGGEASATTSTTSVVITADNKITVNGKKTLPEDLEMMILNEVGENKNFELYADEKSDVGVTVQVLSVGKDNGLKVALMTDK